MKIGLVDLYRKSLLGIAFVLPSALYPLTLVIFALTLFCWFRVGDYKVVFATFRKPQLLWPSLFYFLIAGGFFFADHFGYALTSLSVMAPIILFPLVVGTSSVVDKELIDAAGKVFRFSIYLFLLLALGYAAVDVFLSKATSVLIDESVYHKFSSFGLTRVFNNWHPTYVAMFANIALALQLDKAMKQSRDKKLLAITGLVFFFLSGSIVLLNSIIAFVAYFSVLGYFGLKMLNRVKLMRWIKVSVLAGLLLSGCALVYFNPLHLEKIEKLKSKEFKITDDQQERNVLTMRLAKWDAHWDIFKENCLWGTTSGDIRIKRKEVYLQKGYNDLARYNYNAHNEYMEVLATYGLAGFICLICMLVVPLFRAVHPLYYPFLIIIAVTFLTESLLNRQQGLLAVMFLYALYTHFRACKSRCT